MRFNEVNRKMIKDIIKKYGFTKEYITEAGKEYKSLLSLLNRLDDYIKRKPKNEFVTKKTADKFIADFRKILEYQNIDDKTINRIIRRMKNSFSLYSIDRHYTDELVDIVSNFNILKILAVKPMHFLTVSFYSFLSENKKEKVRYFVCRVWQWHYFATTPLCTQTHF